MMMKGSMCVAHKISAVLLLIGGLNWGLVGVFNYNLVDSLFGSWPLVVRIVYILVGVSAVMMLMACKCCMGGSGMCGMKEGEKKM